MDDKNPPGKDRRTRGKWDDLPTETELTPLNQTLITPILASAFSIGDESVQSERAEANCEAAAQRTLQNFLGGPGLVQAVRDRDRLHRQAEFPLWDVYHAQIRRSGHPEAAGPGRGHNEQHQDPGQRGSYPQPVDLLEGMAGRRDVGQEQLDGERMREREHHLEREHHQDREHHSEREHHQERERERDRDRDQSNDRERDCEQDHENGGGGDGRGACRGSSSAAEGGTMGRGPAMKKARRSNMSGDGESEEGESTQAGGDYGDDAMPRTLKRPRLVWTPQLHKRFVDAVSHLGIKNAVPKTIMQLMNVEGLTRENVASHLQKYRIFLKRMQGLSTDGPTSSDLLFASTPVPPGLTPGFVAPPWAPPQVLKSDSTSSGFHGGASHPPPPSRDHHPYSYGPGPPSSAGMQPMGPSSTSNGRGPPMRPMPDRHGLGLSLGGGAGPLDHGHGSYGNQYNMYDVHARQNMMKSAHEPGHRPSSPRDEAASGGQRALSLFPTGDS